MVKIRSKVTKNPSFSRPQAQELAEGGPGLDAGIIIIVVHLVVYAAAVLDIEYLVESSPKKTIFHYSRYESIVAHS